MPRRYLTLRAFASCPVPPVSLLDDVVLEGAQLVEVDLRLAEGDAPGRGVRASSISLATCSSAFDGMQPR